MIRTNVLFLLVFLFVCISSIKAADGSIEPPSELANGIKDLESMTAQTLRQDEQKLMEGDKDALQLSPAEQHLLPYVQRASSQELSLSSIEIGSDGWRLSINSMAARGELTLPLYITAFNTALLADDWLMIRRLNCAQANEQKEMGRTPIPCADMYYFTNIIGLTLCAKNNKKNSAQAICDHLKSFYKGKNVAVDETHFLRSFFTGANHPLYVAQTYKNTSIIKIMLKTLTKEDVGGEGLIFPRFYEEVFWHAMFSKNVDFVKYLKSGYYQQKCGGEMQNYIEIFLKENDL